MLICDGEFPYRRIENWDAGIVAGLLYPPLQSEMHQTAINLSFLCKIELAWTRDINRSFQKSKYRLFFLTLLTCWTRSNDKNTLNVIYRKPWIRIHLCCDTTLTGRTPLINVFYLSGIKPTSVRWEERPVTSDLRLIGQLIWWPGLSHPGRSQTLRPSHHHFLWKRWTKCWQYLLSLVWKWLLNYFLFI